MPRFSDLIINATRNAQENDHSLSETYFLTLEGMRPDIASVLSGTKYDPFAVIGEHDLPLFLEVVRKFWLVKPE